MTSLLSPQKATEHFYNDISMFKAFRFFIHLFFSIYFISVFCLMYSYEPLQQFIVKHLSPISYLSFIAVFIAILLPVIIWIGSCNYLDKHEIKVKSNKIYFKDINDFIKGMYPNYLESEIWKEYYDNRKKYVRHRLKHYNNSFNFFLVDELRTDAYLYNRHKKNYKKEITSSSNDITPILLMTWLFSDSSCHGDSDNSSNNHHHSCNSSSCGSSCGGD